MSKTIIEVKCFDQVLSFTNTPVITSGGVGEDYVSAEFCEKWDGFTVSMLFWRQGVDPIPVLADAEGLYQVPPELMTSDGVVYFGAMGVDPNGITRTSEGVSYRIKAGAITENTALPEPDGDVFTQLLAQYADVKVYVSTYIQGTADDAATAKAAAEAAARAAAEAVTAAGNAQTTAGNAVTAAGNAQTAAGNAQTTADNAVTAAGNAQAAADAAAAAAETAQTTATGRMKQFWGRYTGDGTSDRVVLFDINGGPSVAVIICKSSSGSYASDIMVVFGNAGWSGFIPYGFQFNGLGGSSSSFSLATGISYNGGIKVNIDGVGGIKGFNESGRSYYVWGLVTGV